MSKNSKNKKRKKPEHIVKKQEKKKSTKEKIFAFLNEYIWIITMVLFVLVVWLIIFSATSCGDSCDSRYASCTASCESLTESCSGEDKNIVKAEDNEQLLPPALGEEYVVMQTNMGTIRIRLFPEEAPETVKNFKNLIYDGYYNGLTFHRVMNDFMIQGGDPDGDGSGGEAYGGGTIKDEFGRNLFNFRGALAMANTGAKNSGGSQFFIVQAKTCTYTVDTLKSAGYPEWAAQMYSQLGGTPHLDGKYNQALMDYNGHTVFGQVFEGMDVVDAIAAVETDANNKPVQDVIITSMYIATYQAASGDAAQQ